MSKQEVDVEVCGAKYLALHESIADGKLPAGVEFQLSITIPPAELMFTIGEATYTIKMRSIVDAFLEEHKRE